ncbi:ribonuclease T2 [Clavulina sp. PMI_390]|nr:ribonuclease T2 [Clavulina sp. PMI_390]
MIVQLALLLPLVSAAVVRDDLSFSRRFNSLGVNGALTSCGTSGAASCHGSSTDTCCYETPGGLLTQVQFWDTNPVTGPVNSWTIHGLWPDHCDGTYSESCDSSRDYTDIGTILKNAGRTDLFTFMTNYMQSNSESNEAFWEHESTHGTCVSTLAPACIPSGSATGTDAVYYFNQIVTLFQSLPTYQWLAAAGITPSSSATYTLTQVQNAIKAAHGYIPAVDCESGDMYQIYYYFNLKGSMIDGQFVPIDAPSAGSCGSSFKYLPKSSGTTAPVSSATGKTTTTTGKSTSVTATTTSTSSGSGVTSIPSKGFLRAASGTGCLLTLGTWSTQTCATITFTTSGSSVTFSTSKGTCGVSGGAIVCGSGLSSTFGAVSSGGNTLLTYSGSSTFSADGTPSGTTVETVYTGSSHSVSLQLVISSS